MRLMLGSLSAGLWLSIVPGSAARTWMFAAAGLAGSIAVSTLTQHITGINLGIDTLFIEPKWGSRAAASPGRPGPMACSAVILLVLALSLLGADRKRRAIVPPLAVALAVLSSLSLIGYLFGADPLYSITRVTAISNSRASLRATP